MPCTSMTVRSGALSPAGCLGYELGSFVEFLPPVLNLPVLKRFISSARLPVKIKCHGSASPELLGTTE